jgi:hypothetical protein
VGFAVVGAGGLVVALLVESVAGLAGLAGGTLLTGAYLAALIVVWMDGHPIGMRGGLRLEKQANPAAYLGTLMLMGLFGLVPLAVCIIGVIVAS